MLTQCLTFLALIPLSAPAFRATAQSRPAPPSMTIKQWAGSDSWTWSLTRRGNTNTYDAVARHEASGRQSNHIFVLRTFEGSTIIFDRPDAGIYTGTVAADGKTVTGTVNFAGGGWSMTLDGSGPAVAAAPAAPAAGGPARLGARLTILQWIGNDRWTWTLTRRGDSNVYDAVARHEASGGLSNDTFTLRSYDGRTVIFERRDAGVYTGTVAPGGKTVNGTVNFAGGGWSMALDGSGQVDPPPPPPLVGIRYRVENLIFKAPDIYQNPRNLHDFMVDFKTCTVRPMIPPEDLARVTVQVHVCREGSRLTFTLDSKASGPVDWDWALLNGGRTVAGAWRQGMGFGPSVGGVLQ
ncbi:MAG: hypothetical protein HY821_00840 [Acidobacteria bacterium]|nr:hypothetical protein [Acidobacteriota bacterium]